jgi:hypothetical protein
MYIGIRIRRGTLFVGNDLNNDQSRRASIVIGGYITLPSSIDVVVSFNISGNCKVINYVNSGSSGGDGSSDSSSSDTTIINNNNVDEYSKEVIIRFSKSLILTYNDTISSFETTQKFTENTKSCLSINATVISSNINGK